jgi:hypothetical protein
MTGKDIDVRAAAFPLTPVRRRPMNDDKTRRRLRRAHLTAALPLACLALAACSSSAPTTPPARASSGSAAATPSSSAAAPTPAAAPAPAGSKAAAPAPSCYDTCGQVVPVLFYTPNNDYADAYNGFKPSAIDLTVDGTPGTAVADNLTWSSWPSAPNGDVAASVTATATGTWKGTGQPLTITLSNPIIGDPTIWGTLTVKSSQGQSTYQYNGLWPVTASGGLAP